MRRLSWMDTPVESYDQMGPKGAINAEGCSHLCPYGAHRHLSAV
jgi:hypothetical protein